MSADIETGTDALRAILVARRMGRASLARDLGVSNETLHAFAHGKGTLPPAVLQALAIDWSGGSIMYDPASDRLRPANTIEPRSQGSGPPPITETMTLPKFKGGPAPAQTGYPSPKPKARRPGWVE